MGMPTQLPNIPNMADQTLAKFLVAKDINDRNPGGRKKKWPIVVAAILITALVALFTVIILHSYGIIRIEPENKTSVIWKSSDELTSSEMAEYEYDR